MVALSPYFRENTAIIGGVFFFFYIFLGHFNLFAYLCGVEVKHIN